MKQAFCKDIAIVLFITALPDFVFAQDPPALIPYQQKDKWGFCNSEKKIIIPTKYENVQLFSEGMAEVWLNGKCGYIDKMGKEVIPIKYDEAFSFAEGLAKVELNKNGVLLIKPARKSYH